LGAPADKLVLGLAMYGRTFTLKTKKQTGINAPATEAGNSGPFTQAAGFLAYFEVCKLMKEKVLIYIYNLQLQYNLIY